MRTNTQGYVMARSVLKNSVSEKVKTITMGRYRGVLVVQMLKNMGRSVYLQQVNHA